MSIFGKCADLTANAQHNMTGSHVALHINGQLVRSVYCACTIFMYVPNSASSVYYTNLQESSFDTAQQHSQHQILKQAEQGECLTSCSNQCCNICSHACADVMKFDCLFTLCMLCAVEMTLKQQQELAADQATADKQARAGDASLDSIMDQMNNTCSIDKTPEEVDREEREMERAGYLKDSITMIMQDRSNNVVGRTTHARLHVTHCHVAALLPLVMSPL